MRLVHDGPPARMIFGVLAFGEHEPARRLPAAPCA